MSRAHRFTAVSTLRGALVIFLACGLGVATACAPLGAPPPAPAAKTAAAATGAEGAASEARGELRAVLDALWEHTLEESPYLRLQEGLRVTELPDLSARDAEEDIALLRRLRERAAAVDPATLDHRDRLSRALVLSALGSEIRLFEVCRWHASGITPYTSPLPLFHRVFREQPFRGAGELRLYLELLAQYPERIRQLQDHLRAQMERGIVLPRAEIDLVVPMLQSFIREPAESPLALAEMRRSGALPEAVAEEAERRIREQVNPALRDLVAFLAGTYESRAPTAVGLRQYPGGEACYRELVRASTTLDISPEEVHVAGLREVERIAARMAEVRAELGFTGTQAEFHEQLRHDPRFRATSAEEIGERLRAHVRRIEPRVSELFSRLPEAPYDVARLDPVLEPVMTYGYYRPPTDTDPRGLYFYNGSDPEERPLFWGQALIYHELIPGHHFQIALQAENEDLHPWRRSYYTSAYGEGWAEYATSLGEELGLYDDPYELYGRYANEIFLASRLVVDTGMNHLGWSRRQAGDWLREHTLASEAEIATETLRYAVDMPGQALAYKMGALTIHRLREKAHRALGERFDLRAFHSAVLETGNVPLPILEQHIDHFVAQHRNPDP